MKEKNVLFTCERYPELNLVLNSRDIATDPKTGRSTVVREHHINFVKKGTPQSLLEKNPKMNEFRGEYITADEDEIAFLRAHEWFNRYIKEEAVTEGARAVIGTKVTNALLDSGKKEEPTAPAEPAAPVGKAKVSKSLKKTVAA